MGALRKTTAAVALLVTLLAVPGCSSRAPATAGGTAAAAAADRVPPAKFLQVYGLHVTGNPERFAVRVPASWEVPQGAYPVGLYWGLANVFSQDVGLDLTPLKGKTVEVWRYALADGLPGEGQQKEFRYPSDVVLLVEQEQVVGAWLAFNRWSVGPSVQSGSLQQITGLAFDEWVQEAGYFADAGPNADLRELGPVEVLTAFLEAISRGDKRRANACLAPATLRDALTMNLEPKQLYNAGFGAANSLVENITQGRLLAHRLVDPEPPGGEIKEVGDRTRVEIVAELELTWREPLAPSAQGRTTRFAVMEKGPNGWKLTGLGTGP